jgi:hypothetical protein
MGEQLNKVAKPEYKVALDFINWLSTEKNVEFTDFETGYTLITKPSEFVDEYFGVNRYRLDEERRALLDEQRKLNKSSKE